uniref:Uncharacterized protein n=1 Tax=Arundo donax TaxID=35708 RepID=A0A0A8ZA29_ARUDO
MRAFGVDLDSSSQTPMLIDLCLMYKESSNAPKLHSSSPL